MRRNLAPGCISSMSTFAKGNPFSLFCRGPLFLGPLVSFFLFFLSPAKVGSLEMQPGAKLQAYLGTPERPVANGECWCRPSQLLITDFVINESTVNCWWYNPEVHQKQPLDFFKAYGRARDERRTLIFYTDSGKGKTSLASCLAAMVARDVGLDEFVMVSSPDMLRSAVERNLLRGEAFAPGRASDQQQQHRRPRRGSGHAEASPRSVARLATIKCRYNDVKVPAETFRITVQDLAKLHHNLDDMAKICPPDLMLDGFEWRARRLTRSSTRTRARC